MDDPLLSDRTQRLRWCCRVIRRILHDPSEDDDFLQRIGSYDDALAIAEWSVFEAARLWQPERASLSTIAFYVARTNLLRAVRNGGTIPTPLHERKRSETRRRAEVCRHVLSLDGLLEQWEGPAWPERDDDTPDLRALRRGMADLPKGDAGILRERFWAGDTLEMIGARRGVTKEAARMKIQTAIRKLRRRMGVDAIHPEKPC